MARDLGLQPERTTLAWRRTMLTAACVTVVCWQSWTDQPSLPMLVVTALSGTAIGATCIGLTQRRRRYRADPRDPRPLATGYLAAASVAPAAAALVYLFSLA
ncbi:DUF202 domain-containing protein [Rhodococcus indonesiensis]